MSKDEYHQEFHKKKTQKGNLSKEKHQVHK
jgi:hypothetical protein